MSASELELRILRLQRAVAECETENFKDLLRAGDFDLSTGLRNHNWSGNDFSGEDLSGIDFSRCNFLTCDFAGAAIAGSSFAQTQIGEVYFDPERGPHQPARVSRVTNLRAARDWKQSRARPDVIILSDDHLPIGAIFQDAPFAPEMVVLPPGRFWMGSKDGEGDDYERPRRQVTIDYRLAVGRFAVTFDEWDFAKKHLDHDPNDEGWGRGRRPVIDVSWRHADAYAKWLSQETGREYRLLTETEWEYACRAGTESAYNVGDEITKEQAQFSKGNLGNAKQTVEVGSFSPNAFGLHDMHGNVWQWCEDALHNSYNGAPDDGTARTSDPKDLSRVLRGGSWSGQPEYLRSAKRGGNRPGGRSDSGGFRLARTLLATP